MPQKISQEQVTLSHGTVQSLRQLLNTHKTTAFGKTIDRGRAIKSYLFPKHGFDNVFTETKNTLRKDIFPRFGQSLEFKTLVEIKRRMFTTESSIKTFLHSPSVQETSGATLYAHSTMWTTIAPELDVLSEDLVLANACRACFSTGDGIASSGLKLLNSNIISVHTLTSDRQFYRIFEDYLTQRYCSEQLRCYRCILIYVLKYQANEPATFERCMFIYMNFIMKNSRYQLCVSKNVRDEIEYKLAQAPIGIFDKLFIRCFKELQNSLQGVNRDAKAGIDLQFIHAIQENVKSRISPRSSSEDHQKQRKIHKAQRARCVIS